MYIVENENIRVEMLKFKIKYLYLINLLEVIFYDAKKYPEKFNFSGYPFYNG